MTDARSVHRASSLIENRPRGPSQGVELRAPAGSCYLERAMVGCLSCLGCCGGALGAKDFAEFVSNSPLPHGTTHRKPDAKSAKRSLST
jgi:hypothetical protein